MNKRNRTILTLTIVTITFIVGIVIFFVRINRNISLKILNNSEMQIKTYQSKVMKFTINLPNGFEVNENLGSVTINASTGSMYIDRNGTNFDTIDMYIKDLHQKNKVNFTNSQALKIDGSSAVKGFIDNKKIYFIYTQYTVYVLSTKESSLYSDLDQIAQSFRYIP